MATQILRGFQRDRRSIPLAPRLHGTQIWLDWPAGHGEEEGWGSWHPGEVEREAKWRGVDWAQASPVAPAPPWNPPLAARSRCMVQTPLPGEEKRKTTVKREGRCSEKDGGDKRGRARTIGHFQGLWPHAGPLGCSLDGRLTGKHLPFYFMWCLQTTLTPHHPAAEGGQQTAALTGHLWGPGFFFFFY